MSSTPKLFQPIQLGDITLQHRVVLAPLTRMRAREDHVHNIPLAKEYYTQRASYPGTLLITEATFIAAKAGGYKNIPGVWSEEQISAWKKITDSVHASGSFIFLQLWALGRAADESVLHAEDPSFPYVSASDIALSGHPNPPRALTTEEIQEYIQLYATAAANSVDKAGFDGVEIHSANGYLLDQFLQDVSNKRTDDYGGSVENRSRLTLEVADAVVKAVGAKKTGIRLSPWSHFQDMRMKEPKPQFTYLVTELKKRHPDFAYIHAVEPVAAGNADREPQEGESNDFLREAWAPKQYISAGGFKRENGIAAAEKSADLYAYGRWFISNPDLVKKLKEDIPLTQYNRDTFYLLGDVSKGYTDYPFADEKAKI